MTIRPVVRGSFTAGAFPARLLQYGGSVVGQLLDDVTHPASNTLVTGCTNKRPCLGICEYSTAVRNMRADYVAITISGIENRTCGPTTRINQIGETVVTYIELAGFAETNGTYILPIADFPVPWATPTTWPCEPRLQRLQWDSTASIRRYGTVAGVPFDNTCTVAVRVDIGCLAVETLPCQGVRLDYRVTKGNPPAITNPSLGNLAWGRYEEIWPCVQAGRAERGLGPLGPYTENPICMPYDECFGFANRMAFANCCPFVNFSVSSLWGQS